MDSFANRLRLLMREFDCTQADICKRTGIASSVISMYLSGQRQPKQDKLYILSESFHVDPAWLMGYDVPIQQKKVEVNTEDAALLARASNDMEAIELLKIYYSANVSSRNALISYARFLHK